MSRPFPSSQRYSTHPSHSSNGQVFWNFLNYLGYRPTSKDTKKPQYFEYLFQDDNPNRAATVRQLIKKITHENVIDALEVETFEQLKAEGQVLYGKDLEEAVDRRSALQQRWSDKKSQKVADKEVLKQLIAQRKKEVEHLKVTRNSIRSFEEELQETESPVCKIKLDRESKELGVGLEVARKRLDRRMGALKELSDDSPGSFALLDSYSDEWKNLLRKEDILYRNTKRLIDENIDHLFIQASELENDDMYQLELTNEFLSVVNEYAENLERLKHSIIYENVRAAECRLKLDYLEEMENQIEICMKEFIRVFQKGGISLEEHRAQIQSIQQQSYTADADLDQRRLEIIEQERNSARLRMNKELKHLVNIQAPARNRLYNFFSSIYAIVEPQKIRLDLVGNIIANARDQELERRRKLQEFRNRSQELQVELDMLTRGPNDQHLNRDGKLLTLLASQRGILNVDLRFFSSSLRALQSICKESDYRSWDESMQNAEESRNPAVRQLNRKYAQLLSTHSNTYLNEIDKYSKQKEELSAAENRLIEKQSALSIMEDNKPQLISESIAKKTSLLDLMKKALSESGNGGLSCKTG